MYLHKSCFIIGIGYECLKNTQHKLLKKKFTLSNEIIKSKMVLEKKKSIMIVSWGT